MPREVKIAKEGKKVYLVSPFHPGFPEEAHKIAGRWNGGDGRWAFDFRHEERVREICRKIYGTDGDDNPKLVTVRAKKAALVSGMREKSWFLAGYLVARTYNKDLPPTIGDGVAVVTGEITSSGSQRNFGLVASDDLVVEMFDVPEPAAKRAFSVHPAGTIEIIEPITLLQRVSAMKCPESHSHIRTEPSLFDALTMGESRITRDADGTPLVESRHCAKCGSDIGRTVSEEAARRLDEEPPNARHLG